MDRDYEVLGLAPDASLEEMKEAYRDLVKVWHPDRFSNDPQLQQKAQAKLKEINAAYARLRAGLGDLGKRQSPRSRTESPPPEQPLHTVPRPPVPRFLGVFGRWYWWMLKYWAVIVCLGLVIAMVVRITGETVLGIGIGGVAVGVLVWSWVWWLRGKL